VEQIAMGAYAELDSLVALQFKARGFSLLHTQPHHSLLFGRRASRVRGRGLDFEELRAYVPGDDVRRIDWQVTARMPKPYVRVYIEERDRPTMLLIDQRINMFFGSKVSMKSVIAAEIAALAAWRVYQQGDRTGAIIFNDTTTEEIRMHRSRAAVLQILEQTSKMNHQLRADLNVKANSQRLNEVIRSATRICKHDALILIASDFHGADETTRDLLIHLSRSNDVVCFLTYDPLAVNLPPAEQLVVSDGELQIELQLGDEKVRSTLLKASDKRVSMILSWQHDLGIPVLPICTAEEVATQINHLLGGIAAIRRHV
jgi:uncharacterized protein (DUF58 family)